MAKFDQIWIDNRFRYRNGMNGRALRMDERTGYLEPITKRGFSAEMKETFIKRFTICSNQRQIIKSLNVDVQSIYDAIALDKKFREDYLKCNSILTRKKQLNDELVNLASSEKVQVITDLTNKLSKYSV